MELRNQWKDRPLLGKADRLRKVAQALKLSRRARHRLEILLWHESHGNSCSWTGRHFGYHRQTIRKWQVAYDPTNLRSLEERPRTPRRVRSWEVNQAQERRIIGLRKDHIRYGPEKLKRLYRDRYGEPISGHKVYRVIKKHRLYYHPAKTENARRRRRGTPKARIGALTLKPETSFLVSLDTVVCYWNAAKRYILTACDAASKLAFARMYSSHSSAAAADFLLRLRYLLPAIQNVHTDNGSEFARYFDAACVYLNLPRYYSRVKIPKDNARLERFNRTLRKEFIDLGNMETNTAAFNRSLTDWLVEYNFRRPHQALGYATPMAYAESSGVAPMSPNRTGP